MNKARRKLDKWERYLRYCERVTGAVVLWPGHMRAAERYDRQRTHALRIFLKKQYRQSSWRATKWG